MYENTDDGYVKVARETDITAGTESRGREGAQTANVLPAERSVLNIIAALAEVALLVGAAIVIWTCNLLVTADGVISPLTGGAVESFTLLGNFGDVIGYFITTFGNIGQSLSGGSALLAVLEILPKLLFLLSIVLTAAFLPLFAVFSLLTVLLRLGRKTVDFTRSLAVSTSLCLAVVLSSSCLVGGITLPSAPVISAVLGLCGLAAAFMSRAFGSRHTAFSFVRFLGGTGTVGGLALSFFFFPVVFTSNGTTAFSALLAAAREPSALPVALSVAAALCTVLSLVTFPIYACRVCVRVAGGKGRIVGHSGSFLITALLTSFALGAYAYYVSPSDALPCVYLYAVGGAVCFIFSLLLKGAEK